MSRFFLIASRRCGQCLFGPNKVVTDASKRKVLRDCVREDRHFVCHKSSIRDPDEDMACRGFVEHYRGVGQLLRIARSLGVAREADPDTGEVVGGSAPTRA